ncbi:hypothetical protein RKD52_000143 [Metabacillus sp. SLBN-84]
MRDKREPHGITALFFTISVLGYISNTGIMVIRGERIDEEKLYSYVYYAFYSIHYGRNGGKGFV